MRIKLNLYEVLQRVKFYRPAKSDRGKGSFYWSSEHHSELSPTLYETRQELFTKKGRPMDANKPVINKFLSPMLLFFYIVQKV